LTDVVLLPVYNEIETVGCVLDAIRFFYSGPVIVVDDGSTDGTREVLAGHDDLQIVSHKTNLGYGRSLIDGFDHARRLGATRVLTMDCDGQHEPQHIPEFFRALEGGFDIVSGSRYLPESPVVGTAPPSRQEINRRITQMVNQATGWNLTDAFCGFKAYRMEALAKLPLAEPGYAHPLELWALSFRAGLRIRELPIARVYYRRDRSFGEAMDDPARRLLYYVQVWERTLRNGRVLG
jgi:glycosyltransferase involved in cell wall biosynthesis